MNVWKYLFKALHVASPNKDKKRNFKIGAVGITKDKKEFSARNLGNHSVTGKCYAGHAEIRLLKKAYNCNVIFVACLTRTGKIGIAKPCSRCEVFLKYKGVKKVYFTNGHINSFGVLDIG